MTALAIAVHATVVLAVQQIVATPLHYVQESLTSPTSVAGLLRVFDEGTGRRGCSARSTCSGCGGCGC